MNKIITIHSDTFNETTHSYKRNIHYSNCLFIHHFTIYDSLQVQLCLNAQMQLIIFAHKSLQADIHHIEVKNENTGFLSIFPNKGGLRISFTIYGTYLTFISCHLAAHEGIKKCHIRNESTSEILGGLRVGDKKYDISCFSHHTIWMGDMNYRITMDKHTPADLDANDKKVSSGAMWCGAM